MRKDISQIVSFHLLIFQWEIVKCMPIGDMILVTMTMMMIWWYFFSVLETRQRFSRIAHCLDLQAFNNRKLFCCAAGFLRRWRYHHHKVSRNGFVIFHFHDAAQKFYNTKMFNASSTKEKTNFALSVWRLKMDRWVCEIHQVLHRLQNKEKPMQNNFYSPVRVTQNDFRVQHCKVWCGTG